MNNFSQVVETLEFLKEDPMIIKRVKGKLDELIGLLQQDSGLEVDKALRELEELDSSDIPSKPDRRS